MPHGPPPPTPPPPPPPPPPPTPFDAAAAAAALGRPTLFPRPPKVARSLAGRREYSVAALCSQQVGQRVRDDTGSLASSGVNFVGSLGRVSADVVVIATDAAPPPEALGAVFVDNHFNSGALKGVARAQAGCCGSLPRAFYTRAPWEVGRLVNNAEL